MNLYEKYNKQGPRYTSYPTIPFWKKDMDENTWHAAIQRVIHDQQASDQLKPSAAIYVHLPYCESLCTFCGCHKRITKNHGVESPYLEAVQKEWERYREIFGQAVEIEELHLGGGTPTFFSAGNLEKLTLAITTEKDRNNPNRSFSFEANPKNTTSDHLQVLKSVGFNRLSLGVQDYSPIVQVAINRIQPFETVKRVHDEARKLGYLSISHDLVYGLPFQTLANVKETVLKTIQLLPDRISLYSYAHVPWIKGNGQRGFDEKDIPEGEAKRALYELAQSMLIDAGYVEIGMDHFALPHDSMAIAHKQGELHRNFMGYTTTQSKLLIGLGASAISDAWYGYVQNPKQVEEYVNMVNVHHWHQVFETSHQMTSEDNRIRQQILDIMCQGKTKVANCEKGMLHAKQVFSDFINDGLITVNDGILEMTEKGMPFIRNICMELDQYLPHHSLDKPLFSKTV